MITEAERRTGWMSARQAIVDGHFDKAEKLLSVLYSPNAHIALKIDYISTLVKTKKYTQAHECLDQAILQYPTESRLYAMQASLLYIRGKYTEALSLYKKLLAENSEEPSYWSNAAYCSCLLGQFVEAVQFFEKSEELLETYPSTWLRNYSMALLMTKNPRKAYIYFEKLAIQKSLDSEENFHYGLCCDLIGLEDKAEALYITATAQDPNAIAPLYNLSILYQRANQSERAQQLWRMILDKEPNHILAKTLWESSHGYALDRLPRAFVEALFDQYSFNYDHHLKETLDYQAPAYARSALLRYCPHVQPGIVVDLGAGTGVMGRVMRDLATYMIAVDCSEGMLLQARQSGIYDDYLCEDVLSWVSAWRSPVDYFTLIELSNYLGPSMQDLLGALWERLSPGGVIILTAEKIEDESNGGVVLQSCARFAFHESFFINTIQKISGAKYAIETGPIRKHQEKVISGLYIFLWKPKDLPLPD